MNQHPAYKNVNINIGGHSTSATRFDGLEFVFPRITSFRPATAAKVGINLVMEWIERAVENSFGVRLPYLDHRIRNRFSIPIIPDPNKCDAFTRGLLIHQITLYLTINLFPRPSNA